jgi:hypothetical protein
LTTFTSHWVYCRLFVCVRVCLFACVCVRACACADDQEEAYSILRTVLKDYLGADDQGDSDHSNRELRDQPSTGRHRHAHTHTHTHARTYTRTLTYRLISWVAY